jgi:hypothetical protein
VVAFTRKADTIMGQKAYGRGRNAPMVDLKDGAQNGHLQDWPSYISNTPYVRRNLIVKVLAGPRGFNLLPEPTKWFQTLKAVLELHPETVEGFTSTLEIETRDVSFSGDGNRQESVSNVTRGRVEPVFHYVEKYGRPFAHFFERWVTELIMDPVTKYPGVTNRAAARAQDIDLLPDFTSATIIAFEPDPSFRKVDKAWLVADLKPKGSLVPVEGRRDINNGGDIIEFQISFTGIAQISIGVDMVAQALLDAMNTVGANPLTQPAFTTQADGNIADLTSGYTEKLSEAAARRVATI